MQPPIMNYWSKSFKQGILLSALGAIILFAGTIIFGNNEFFLMINGDLGKVADRFFAFYTNLGDGICWLIWLALFIIYKRKDILFIVFGFVYNTIFTQSFKYFIIPDTPRPMNAIKDHSLIHTVPGVEIHYYSSFPSGHTTTAFIFYLFACIIFNNKWVIYLGFIPALMVGYSRVYLAQHFPRDVAGGMVMGIICSVLSVVSYQWVQKRRAAKQTIA